jgi:hypothetical protein
MNPQRVAHYRATRFFVDLLGERQASACPFCFRFDRFLATKWKTKNTLFFA